MEASSQSIPVTPDNAIVWQNNRLYLLDQRYLPHQTDFVELSSAQEVAYAIRDMVVRGAPAIGITAAFGVVLSVMQAGEQWRNKIDDDIKTLAASRPTAVNLFWALERMKRKIDSFEGDQIIEMLLNEAKAIHQEDIEANHKMGALGSALVEGKTRVITHCNAGALATGGYGTALGVIRSLHANDKLEQVFADETRPWLQGSRLTAWELLQDDIPVSLLADGAAASLMSGGDIGWVIVGSDRIAGNGDVANKIGTYSLAVAAKYHGVKVMVVAPTSTIDMGITCGKDIPIEVRESDELLYCGDKRIGASGASVWNPVFDVTPASLVDAIVTERGVVLSPNSEKMAKLMS
jgi:methylthioribose-1-phosphate isomerase